MKKLTGKFLLVFSLACFMACGDATNPGMEAGNKTMPPDSSGGGGGIQDALDRGGEVIISDENLDNNLFVHAGTTLTIKSGSELNLSNTPGKPAVTITVKSGGTVKIDGTVTENDENCIVLKNNATVIVNGTLDTSSRSSPIAIGEGSRIIIEPNGKYDGNAGGIDGSGSIIFKAGSKGYIDDSGTSKYYIGDPTDATAPIIGLASGEFTLKDDEGVLTGNAFIKKNFLLWAAPFKAVIETGSKLTIDGTSTNLYVDQYSGLLILKPDAAIETTGGGVITGTPAASNIGLSVYNATDLSDIINGTGTPTPTCASVREDILPNDVTYTVTTHNQNNNSAMPGTHEIEIGTLKWGLYTHSTSTSYANKAAEGISPTPTASINSTIKAGEGTVLVFKYKS